MEKAKLLLDAHAKHGESPYWCAEKKKLYWLDILGKAVHIFDPFTKEDEEILLPILPTTLVEKSGGGFLISSTDGIYGFDKDFLMVKKELSLEEDNPLTRFNDGKADKSGRLWAGSMHIEAKPGYGSLYCIGEDYSSSKMIGDVDISNGIVWTADRTKMYYTHTLSGEILLYDYDDNTGDISDPRVEYTFKDKFPDGMAIDASDNLWIALWGEGKVVCLDTKTHKEIFAVEVEAPLVSAVAFGGDDLKTLFITTSMLGMSEDDLEKHPLSGGLFSYKTDIKGTLFNKFSERK